MVPMDGVERSRPTEEQVAESVSLIEAYVDQLRTLARPEALRTDVREQRFIAHTLQVALQAAHDVASRAPWLPEHFVPKLQSLDRFRNVLIHRTAIDPDLLVEALAQAPDVLLTLVRIIRPQIQPLTDIKTLAATVGDLGFGRIDERLIASVLRAVDTGQETQQEALAQTRSALRRAIAFLQETVQFPRIELLPTEEILVVLALFFHQHPAPSPRTKQLLSRWAWRTAVSLQAVSPALPPGDEAALVQRLLTEVRKPASGSLDLRRFSLGSAQTKLQLAGLAALRPRHLVTGEVLDMAALCEQPGGPAVPLSSSHAGLANYVLHPPAEDAPLADLMARCDRKDVLRSHCVSPEARDLLHRGELGGFLGRRGSDLQSYIDSFLEAKAQWDASDRDRPALASLIVADE
jgi:uncharacterized protein YutE (UPF0331/DUF86 family)